MRLEILRVDPADLRGHLQRLGVLALEEEDAGELVERDAVARILLHHATQ